jgi:hypothetical protein
LPMVLHCIRVPGHSIDKHTLHCPAFFRLQKVKRRASCLCTSITSYYNIIEETGNIIMHGEICSVNMLIDTCFGTS